MGLTEAPPEVVKNSTEAKVCLLAGIFSAEDRRTFG